MRRWVYLLVVVTLGTCAHRPSPPGELVPKPEGDTVFCIRLVHKTREFKHLCAPDMMRCRTDRYHALQAGGRFGIVGVTRCQLSLLSDVDAT